MLACKCLFLTTASVPLPSSQRLPDLCSSQQLQALCERLRKSALESGPCQVCYVRLAALLCGLMVPFQDSLTRRYQFAQATDLVFLSTLEVVLAPHHVDSLDGMQVQGTDPD